MRALRHKLLRWYDQTARDLPWRRTRDPYAIWVSETMLQQTRVETVIPYYERFLRRFPTAESLAEAEEDEVLSQWSGLGYYRRARLLHAGAREVVARYGGRVPEEAQDRRSLPGVGRYTAGAIGSIAFDKPEPVVDGNVTRVLTRLFGIDNPVGTAATTKRLWAEATKLVRGERPGALNQALMELGATVCAPRPRCEVCPVAADCRALARGDVQALPVVRPRKAPAVRELVAVVATRGKGPSRSVWLVRSEERLFGGLWGVPTAPRDGSGLADARSALRACGISARMTPEPPARLEHLLSHRRLRLDVFRAIAAQAQESEGRRSFTTADLAHVGVSSLTRRILAAALAS